VVRIPSLPHCGRVPSGDGYSRQPTSWDHRCETHSRGHKQSHYGRFREGAKRQQPQTTERSMRLYPTRVKKKMIN